MTTDLDGVTVEGLPIDGVHVLGVVRDEGSIVVSRGQSENGTEVHFAVDHRCAQTLVDALTDVDGDSVTVSIEPWQVVFSCA